jgi:hypothetical protein
MAHSCVLPTFASLIFFVRPVIITSTVEAASLNNARILRFEAFATTVTFGVMSSWSLVGSCYRFVASCYANVVLDVENKCEISGSQSGTAEDSGLRGCDTAKEGPAVLQNVGNYSPNDPALHPGRP